MVGNLASSTAKSWVNVWIVYKERWQNQLLVPVWRGKWPHTRAFIETALGLACLCLHSTSISWIASAVAYWKATPSSNQVWCYNTKTNVALRVGLRVGRFHNDGSGPCKIWPVQNFANNYGLHKYQVANEGCVDIYKWKALRMYIHWGRWGQVCRSEF